MVCVRFVKQHLHGGMPESIDVEALKKEVEELRQKNADLESQVALLQAEVWCLGVCYLYHSIFYFVFQLAKYTEGSEV